MSRAMRAPGRTRRQVEFTRVKARKRIFVTRRFYKSDGRYYGLRRYTRAPRNTWHSAYATRRFYSSGGCCYGLRRYTNFTLPLIPLQGGGLLSRAMRAPGRTRRQVEFTRVKARKRIFVTRRFYKSDGRYYGLRRYTRAPRNTWHSAYATRRFYSSGGCCYGLRRYTNFTLPLIPLQGGGLLSRQCALRVEPAGK